MSYGINQDVYIELLKNRIIREDIESGVLLDSEIEQIADLRMSYDEDKFSVTPELIEIDMEIVKQARGLGKYIFDEGHYNQEMKNFWAWNPDKIAKGDFPIDKIPEHVRDLATNLYYGGSN